MVRVIVTGAAGLGFKTRLAWHGMTFSKNSPCSPSSKWVPGFIQKVKSVRKRNRAPTLVTPLPGTNLAL